MQPVQLPAGSEPLVTVSKAHEHVWVIEMHNGPDNRLTQDMCMAIIPALDVVEKSWRDAWRAASNDKGDKEKTSASGALIIVANRKQHKFFSNGFDYPTLLKRPHFIPSMYSNLKGILIDGLFNTAYYHPVQERLLGFPIPVIAAINGHAFAAGFLLAMACDYRIMKASKAWLSMNELLFGAPIPHSFMALFSEKAEHTIVRKVEHGNLHFNATNRPMLDIHGSPQIHRARGPGGKTRGRDSRG
jgi:Delta3-Delta2-enoyl-CoA isomerase